MIKPREDAGRFGRCVDLKSMYNVVAARTVRIWHTVSIRALVLHTSCTPHKEDPWSVPNGSTYLVLAP